MSRPSCRMLAAMLLLSSGSSQLAAAHAILMSSTPALAGHATAGALPISLRYNSLVDAHRSRVVLIDPQGREQPLHVSKSIAGDTLIATSSVAAGHYVLRWQVLATDGHITRGDVPFDVTAAADPARH